MTHYRYAVEIPEKAAREFLRVYATKYVFDACSHTENGKIDLTSCALFRDSGRNRAAAESLKSLVEVFLAYEDGKAGRPLIAGGGLIFVRRK